MFTINEKSALLYEKVKFLTSPNQASSSAVNLLQINSAWYSWYKKVYRKKVKKSI